MRAIVVIILAVHQFALSSHATVTEFTNKQAWESAVGDYITIDFTGYPNNTLITTQYESLGLVFTDGADFVHYSASYVNDGVGLRSGLPGTIVIQFIQPIQWMAAECPGLIWIELYDGNNLIYASDMFGAASNFAGIVARQQFDEIRFVTQVGGSVSIDDLHFGPTIPAPGALALVSLVACGVSRRRRGE